MADQIFTIEQKINESATTTVYRASQEALDRVVLLKVLHKSLIGDEDFVARFRREARACAAIHSEHIVQVYDLTEIEGSPAIVMEFVEGRSVKEILESEGKQPIEFARKVAIDVLKGLAVAHNKGIIHRDIKPGNILVGKSGVVKVTDFGLATVPRSPTLTLDGMVLGTPAYMSPEQARGEVVDARTDLFSLGVSIVEILTGRRIFEGASYSECLKRILSFSPRHIEDELSPFTDDFSSLVLRLLAPRKEDRFPTAEEALRSLEHDGKKLPQPRKKSRIIISLAGAAAVVILAGLWFSFTPHHDDRVVPDTGHDSLRTTVKLVMPTDSSVAQKQIPHTRKMKIGDEPVPIGATSAKFYVDNDSTNSDSGTVVVRCVPWGMVYINNAYIGQTPLSHGVQVKSGNATVTFNNPFFVPITRNVTVQKNTQIVVEENFLDYAGYVMVRVTPWGEVYVDDRYRDTTPLGKPLIASAGTRKIRIHNPAYEDVVYNAQVKKGDTLSLSFDLRDKKNP
ncbi:MAG TPA: serine/threonine-protein kinase [Bacteroidota bacterium]|nr:serine/threonine-protein kinase [Bacteroidota bacterium]